MSESNPVTVAEVLTLAQRAEQSGQPNVARSLYETAGRMDRTFGHDGFDREEDPRVAEAVAVRRARPRINPLFTRGGV